MFSDLFAHLASANNLRITLQSILTTLFAVFLALNLPQQFHPIFMEMFSDLFEQLEHFNNIWVELQNTVAYATYCVTCVAPMAPKHMQRSMVSMASNLAAPLARLTRLSLNIRDSFSTFLIPNLATQLLYVFQHTRKFRLP